MTIRELLAAIDAANIADDTEVFGPSGPLRCVHLEDGVLVLDETAPTFVRQLAHLGDTEVLWEMKEDTGVQLA